MPVDSLIKIILNTILINAIASQAYSISPWPLDKGETSYAVAFVSESFDQKWLGNEKSAIAQINQSTLWLSVGYGLSEQTQIQIDTGYTRSTFDASETTFSGIADTKLSIKHLLMNEFNTHKFSASILVGAILRGGYDRSFAGNPHSPGDKANGIEVSLPMSKSFGHWSVLAQAGYRFRFNDVPDDLFYHVGLGWGTDKLYIQGKYLVEDGRDGLDIGIAPFTPNDFHRTEEEREMVEVTFSFSPISNTSVFLGLADTLDGRNTGDSTVIYIGLNLKQ